MTKRRQLKLFLFNPQQEDTSPAQPDARPTTTEKLAHYDPLALDLEDLYVKYKVSYFPIAPIWEPGTT